jgi:Uncharacterized vancomycin resistance protein
MFSSAVLLLPNIGSDNDIVNFIGQYKNDEPDKSGPVERLPWEEDENFIEAQLKNNTPVLMAAYHAVLNDPLPGEEYNVHLGARLVAGTVVKSGEVFSQNLTIGPYTTHRGYKKGPTYSGTKLTTTIGGGVCKIASTLYNTVVLSNLQVVERHSHSMPVPYVPYGQDATVSYGVYDFKFKNNTKDPIMIWAQGVDNILFMAIYGVSKPPRIEWNHQILSTRKSPVIYKKNNELPVGTKKVVMDGMDGAVIKSSIIIYKTDGTKEVKNMGNSSYRPLPTIVETGT